MQNPVFELITIKEVKSQYSFLPYYETFDYFEDWDDEDFFLVAKGNADFEGNFYLDLFEDKEKKWLSKVLNLPAKKIEEIRIEGILINGNLSVNGAVINAEGDYGPFVFVSGDLNCQSLLLGGANVQINGNVTAKEVVMTYYNHGSFNCAGVIDSPVFIVTDHNTTFADRKNELFYYNDREDDVDPENEYEYDEETGDEIMSKNLRKLLDNPLIETFEELERDLARGELVLKQNNPPAKTFEYWRDRVSENYRNLKLVPKEFKTEELCLLALEKTYHALPFVNQDLITHELCEKLVTKDGFAIGEIPDEFITQSLCFTAAESGTMLRFIPEEFYFEELIISVFKNGKNEPDIKDVPLEFITKNLLQEYIKIGKGLWLDKACKENEIDKLEILKKVIDSGIENLEAVFGNHFSKETVDYAFSVYYNQNKEEWDKYVQKYKTKFERFGLEDYLSDKPKKILIQNKGIKTDQYFIPPFDVKEGDFVLIDISGHVISSYVEEKLTAIFTGKEKHENVTINKSYTFVKHFRESEFRHRFFPTTVGEYLAKNANSKSKFADKIYEINWINKKTQINRLEGNNRKLISLYSTLSKTNNIVFDLAGQDWEGMEHAAKIVKDEIADDGSAIVFDWSDHLKNVSTKYIKIEWLIDLEEFSKTFEF